MTAWPLVRLGDALELAYGKSLPKNRREAGGDVPVYGSNGITGWHNEALVTEPTVIVGRKGSAGAVQYVDGPCYPIDTTYFVRARDGYQFDSRFLFYLLSKIDLSRLRTATGVPGLTREDAYRELIPNPPLEDQRRVVDILCRAEGIVRLRREAEAKAKEIIPALFIDMFGDPSSNAKSFPVKTLGQLVKVKSGDFLPAKSMDDRGAIPVYGGNGVNGYHSAALFEDRKIVIGRVGAYCGNVHITSGPSWITDNALYVAERDESIAPCYLAAALRHARLNRLASQAGQPLISAGRIYPVQMLVPPMELQQTFEERATLGLSIERQQATALLKAEATFAALLSRTFSVEPA